MRCVLGSGIINWEFMQKVLVSLLIIAVSLFVFPSLAQASPGGLDKNGGHRCRKSVSYCAKYGVKLNQYHCHRSYCKPLR